jgi:dolichol-phosphate mannosyltransferase|tara:strand:- start:206 stop:901 length:696 start_codon:yes stop_codon:yes gene_type:complete
MDKKISIILSTYNEAYIIKTAIDKIFSTLDNVEIVLVDDNSEDGTLEILKTIQNKNFKFYSRKSRGLASAFLLGLINTNGDYVGWIDSNMPQLVSHFNEMIKKLEKYDVVLLSRYVDGGGDKRSKIRILSSKTINFFCRLILGSEIKDYTSSIFLMRKEVLNYGVPIAYGHGEFFIEFLYKIKKNGMKICELPYVQPADLEGSKTASSYLRFFSLGLSYLIRILIIRFRKN